MILIEKYLMVLCWFYCLVTGHRSVRSDVVVVVVVFVVGCVCVFLGGGG